MDDELARKLARLGLVQGSSHVQPPAARPEEYSIPAVIPGEELTTAFGQCYRVRKLPDEIQMAGAASLVLDGGIGLVAEWARLQNLQDLTADNIIFLDTETSGLAGGTGTYAFLVGLCRPSGNGVEFTQFLLRDPAEEEAMLAALAEYMHGAHAVVTYNGKSFDIPLLNTRYALHRLTSPFIDLDHIDLLHLVRKVWKKKLESKRLASVEVEILRVERSSEEVPGYLVPQVYFDYLKSGDARQLAGVLYHNEMDVLSLVSLLQYFLQSFSPAVLQSTTAPEEMLPIINLNLDLGRYEDAEALFERMIDTLPLSAMIDWQVVEKMGYHYRHRQNYAMAERIWQSAATRGFAFGMAELCKYYEHKLRDYKLALDMAQSMAELIERSNLPPFSKRQQLEQIEKRMERIRSKIK